MKKIVIIGNGISGITAARHIRKKSDYEITVISDETDHFYSRTALMYIYMGHMEYRHTKPYEDWFWKKNRISLVRDYVKNIDFSAKKLSMRDGEAISYDKLIIAVGSKPNKFGWPGENLEGVTGLYGMPDLDYMERYTKEVTHAVVLGGGLIGIEMVEMLLSRNIPVTFLVREKSFWNRILPLKESEMVNRQIKAHHVDLRLSTELEEILDDGKGRVRAISTKAGEEITCQFVGLTVGVTPNVDFLRDTDLEIGRGVLVNEYFETNQPDVYSIGDCAEFTVEFPGRKKIEQVWYTGRIHGEILAATLCGNRTAYQPGVWFNSAKFMDIEYQVYGEVSNEPQEHEQHLYWEHPDGQKSIRIVYSKQNGNVSGFNLMGVRYRHEVCERWIKTKTPIWQVLPELHLANFDPEFFDTYENQLIQTYYEVDENAVQLESKSKRKKILNIFSL